MSQSYETDIDPPTGLEMYGQVIDCRQLLNDLKDPDYYRPDLHADPAFLPLIDQIDNELKHVTLDYKIASDSEDYPYDIDNRQAYPDGPTHRAVFKVSRLQDLLSREPAAAEPVSLPEGFAEAAAEAQNAITQNLLNDPLAVYADMQERRDLDGPEAQFPELGWTLKGLYADMVTRADVAAACEQSPLLSNLRAELLANMDDRIESEDYGYEATFLAIEDAVNFFDIVVRTNDPDSPALYHSGRFGYNLHTMLEDPELTLLPLNAPLFPVDLMKVRGVPVAPIGVSPTTLTVDGFPQTPAEFFHHDIDHTRRMNEASVAAIEREGVTPEKFAKDATDLIFNTLLPAIDIDGLEDIKDADERDKRIAMRMIMFEILHEDGADPTRDTIAEGILRAPMERTPFERLLDDNKTVEYYMGPRATTLAHVYRKLAHTFYDFPDRRSSNLGTDYARTRNSIAEAAATLYRLVSDDTIEDEALLNSCRALVSTDEGFTDGFLGGLEHDIRRRAVGRKTLGLMITRPLGVDAAVRKARSYGPHLHSLFGYSGLEYQDFDRLQKTVAQDLQALDPEETVIAIGATPYGIGGLYPLVKDLGFKAVGIVASTAIARNEECSEVLGSDDLIVVKDNGWGGFRYSQETRGLLSPTTRVFVGASDSLAAYGGGNITAVSMEEMLRREKYVSFKAFDMNHNLANLNAAQRGETEPIDYRGPAYAKAAELGLV
ncbi:MAG TPA: hypothetical protein VG992_00885 [Candidatus Saccharimonadales bacterium]|nr:hypothetical protein [Candidatus Saccharimonadales bacterium]